MSSLSSASRILAASVALAVSATGGLTGTAGAATFDSFLEPARQADLLPASRDIIVKIHVKEGDLVKRGQLLISLPAETLKARLQAATIMANARGKLDSARVVERMRMEQLDDLKQLAGSGNVRPRELAKAEADLAIARAEVAGLLEERQIRLAEQQQIKAQIAEKELRAPIDGIVTRLSKEEGELTGQSDQDVLVTIVQEHPLQAVFHLPAASAVGLAQGGQVRIATDQAGPGLPGTVEFISPVTNPESGTIKVKISLRDDLGAEAGQRCRLNLPDPTAATAPAP